MCGIVHTWGAIVLQVRRLCNSTVLGMRSFFRTCGVNHRWISICGSLIGLQFGYSTGIVLGMATAQALPISKPTKPKRQRRRAKLDEAQVNRMALLGLKQSEIAQHQGVDPSVISRYLAERKITKSAVDTFRAARADVFADLQSKAIHAQSAIIDSLFQDGILKALDEKTKAGLMTALNAVSGTIYDKERLETGKSTQNVSTLARILGSAFDQVHNPLKDKDAEK